MIFFFIKYKLLIHNKAKVNRLFKKQMFVNRFFKKKIKIEYKYIIHFNQVN